MHDPLIGEVHVNTDLYDLEYICSYLSLGKPITRTLFRQWNLKKIFSYMAVLKLSSPRHKFRFSDQVWLRQDKTADHILRRLHERWVKGG